MSDLVGKVIENSKEQRSQFSQRKHSIVRVCGEEHLAEGTGSAVVYLTLDNDMAFISEMKFKLVLGNPGSGDTSPTPVDVVRGTNSFPTFQSWVEKYPIGSAIDTDGAYGAQCPVANTMVLMDDGKHKAIQDIEVGEKVYGGKTVISNSPKQSDIIEVETNLGIFRVTPDHKFIGMDGSEIQAKDITVGEVLDYDWAKKVKTEDELALTREELNFLGFWLGDGHLKHKDGRVSEIGVTIGTEFKKEYIDTLGIGGRWEKHSNGKADVFYLSFGLHPNLSDVIKRLNGKELPEWFTPKQALEVVDGYFHADGELYSYYKENKIKARSTDKKLLVGIQHALLINGWVSKISRPQHRKSTNFCEHPKDIYTLSVSRGKLKGAVVIGVKEVEPDTVYVFNIDGDHLYYGDNVLHHNCWDYANAFWLAQCNRALLTGPKGAAKECWSVNRTANAGTEFDLITSWNSIKRGDWIVWGNGTYGHIAMAYSDGPNADGTITIWGQNQGGIPWPSGGAALNSINMSSSSFLGAFRYKPWQ